MGVKILVQFKTYESIKLIIVVITAAHKDTIVLFFTALKSSGLLIVSL